MINVVTIVGTRPELIKMSRLIALLDEYTNHSLVHTGQNFDYELNQIFFDELNIRKPDYFLNVKNSTPINVIANILTGVDEVLEKIKPDAVLLYGDTNSCLSSVICAKKRKIPIFHMEAGNRCYDQRVPEEMNRKVVDHLSDINLVLTEHARRNLMNEGISSEFIIKTGSHMREVIWHYFSQIEDSRILQVLNLISGGYFVVSAHREENVDDPKCLLRLIESLNCLSAEYSIPVIVSTHPRTKLRLEALGSIELNPLIRFVKPLGFLDYLKLQMNAFCVLSDSGTITEECGILGFPALNIRNTHERPEGMDAGVLIMSGLDPKEILNGVKIAVARKAQEKFGAVVHDYHDGNVSSKILNIIISYVPYVNRVVWSKS